LYALTIDVLTYNVMQLISGDDDLPDLLRRVDERRGLLSRVHTSREISVCSGLAFPGLPKSASPASVWLSRLACKFRIGCLPRNSKVGVKRECSCVFPRSDLRLPPLATFLLASLELIDSLVAIHAAREASSINLLIERFFIPNLHVLETS
jgi:hypothetical protein